MVQRATHSRSEEVQGQLDKLDTLEHNVPVTPTFDAFDAETEQLLMTIYGAGHEYVESYKYATVGEAEALVNMPESAQEPQARDLPKKSLQQRRQLLSAVLTDLHARESAGEAMKKP